MKLAKSLDAADTYIELSRKDNKPQLEKLKADNPYGFDIGKSRDAKYGRASLTRDCSHRSHWLREAS